MASIIPVMNRKEDPLNERDATPCRTLLAHLDALRRELEEVAFKPRSSESSGSGGRGASAGRPAIFHAGK